MDVTFRQVVRGLGGQSPSSPQLSKWLRGDLACAGSEPAVAIFCHHSIHPSSNRHRGLGESKPGNPSQIPRRDRHELHPGICGHKNSAICLKNHRVGISLAQCLVAHQDIDLQRLMSTLCPLFGAKFGNMAKVTASIVEELPSCHRRPILPVSIISISIEIKTRGLLLH